LPLISQSIDIHEGWHVKEGRFLDIKSQIERKISESKDESDILSGLETLEKLPFIHKRESEIQNKTKTFTLVKYVFLEENILDFKNRTVSLFLPEAGNQVEIYWNGVLLKSFGKLGEEGIIEMGFRRNIIVPIPSTWILNGDNQLAIQISGFDHDNFYLSSYTENIPARITYWDLNVKDLSEHVTLMLLFLYLFVGFYHLLLYGKRKQEKYNLYFDYIGNCSWFSKTKPPNLD